jgi:hypothetical protein
MTRAEQTKGSKSKKTEILRAMAVKQKNVTCMAMSAYSRGTFREVEVDFPKVALRQPA